MTRPSDGILAKINDHVFTRKEKFGASVYVSHRDDFFFLDEAHSRLLFSLTQRPKFIKNTSELSRLISLGIAVAIPVQPEFSERNYSGVHLVGDLPTRVPVIDFPLLVNCFCTAWCPLKCVYCHADDLMGQARRDAETDDGIELVSDMAIQIPAMVYVITGGDPISAPDRAIKLAKALPANRGVVLDTSGVGKVSDLIRILQVRPMHLRVSIDSVSPDVNRKTRPTNNNTLFKLVVDSGTALESAKNCIREARGVAAGISVQTVISTKNDRIEYLLELRDWLISVNVKNWVLHLATPAGAALRFQERTSQELKEIANNELKSDFSRKKRNKIIPNFENVSKILSELVQDTVSRRLPIDIRITHAEADQNSVLIIDSLGNLLTQSTSNRGKETIAASGTRIGHLQSIWFHASQAGHVKRYINFTPITSGVISETGENFLLPR